MLDRTCVVSIMLMAVALTGCAASTGDHKRVFRTCRQTCERHNCSAAADSGTQQQERKYYRQTWLDKLLFWRCVDECQYECMWHTVRLFAQWNRPAPQFYGKWPFRRVLGMQEPASVLFSALNFIVHVCMLRKLRREVCPASPGYRIWNAFALIALNSWIWSAVFHARDRPLTELLDYAFAYSIVLGKFYCTVMRMLASPPLRLRMLVTVAFLSFYITYFVFLGVGKLSYDLNMQLNILTGALPAAGWFVWCYRVRHQRPYYKYILLFYILFGAALSLEFVDFPPILWTLDAHALWHLATAPIVTLLYLFAIRDCNALHKDQQI